jgi:hypothetical protein
LWFLQLTLERFVSTTDKTQSTWFWTISKHNTIKRKKVDRSTNYELIKVLSFAIWDQAINWNNSEGLPLQDKGQTMIHTDRIAQSNAKEKKSSKVCYSLSYLHSLLNTDEIAVPLLSKSFPFRCWLLFGIPLRASCHRKTDILLRQKKLVKTSWCRWFFCNSSFSFSWHERLWIYYLSQSLHNSVCAIWSMTFFYRPWNHRTKQVPGYLRYEYPGFILLATD